MFVTPLYAGLLALCVYLYGLTLVSEYDGHTQGGRVYELGKDGKERWAVTGLSGPNDVQPLPGGRVLIAERNACSRFTTAGSGSAQVTVS